MRNYRIGLLLLVTLVAMAPVVAAKSSALAKWLEGPIRYITKPDEIKEYKRLKSDAERAAYVERFWRRRDPSPSTLLNEYRQLFWQRVRDADEKFVDSAAPGWKTDRGKIYILYGPPEEIREDPNARTESDVASAAGLIRWTYTRPGNRMDMDAIVYVPFVRDVSGEYRLSYDPHLSSPFFNWNDVDNTRFGGLGDFLAAPRTTSRDPLGVMLDLGKLQEVPPQEAIILETIDTIETFAFEPLPLALERFEPPDGGLIVVATVGVPGPADVPPATILGRFGKPGAPKGARLLGEGSFRVEGEGDARVAQARIVLDPGVWDVTILAVDAASGSNRIFRGRIEPLAPGALRTSDVVLARSMEPLPFATQASYDAPYIVGGFRVTPLVGTSLPRGEPVQIFYEIYGGTAPFGLAYQVEGQEEDGRWRSLGGPQERESSERGQGFALQTSSEWPLGAYRIQIRATDALGHMVERVRPFRLDAEVSGP